MRFCRCICHRHLHTGSRLNICTRNTSLNWPLRLASHIQTRAICLLVGVCMVYVVLDPPGLKGVYERSKHEGAHNVLYKLVAAECSVPTVMPNHKEL